MKRRFPIVVAVAVVAILLVVWRCRGADPASTAGDGSALATGGGVATGGTRVASQRRTDPKGLVRGSIAGTITDEAKQPVAKARVCADGTSNELADELLREPSCVLSDDQGRFRIEDLFPAVYTVSASARPFRPTVHHPGGDLHEDELRLAAGEHKTGVDITLRPGGVEVTGVVADLTGGPIANARVWSSGSWNDHDAAMATTETDTQGKFSLWVKQGQVTVHAAADGYADDSESTTAPGKLELLLTPESSLSGTVVDAATNQPVEGARVMVGTSEWGWDEGETVFSNAQGAFRVARLTPGRYIAVSRTDRGYGRTEGSTLVGLGQHVDGIVVKLFPAHRIEGKVVLSTTKAICEHASLSLRDLGKDKWIETRRNPDGTLYADGVLPGTYNVEADCQGYQSRDKYEPIVIADHDATGLVWEVDPGATVRGRVVTKGGDPVEDASISARTIGGGARDKAGWASASSARDGKYELVGLKPGTYKLEVSTDRGIGPRDGYKITVAPGADVERELVVEDGGTIKGVVVDAEGKPVAGIDIDARATSDTWSFGQDHKSDDAGEFALQPLRPGEYRVTARRSWSDQLRKPGTNDDAKQGEKVTVRPNVTATVRLVVESQSGVIKGTVVDTEGKPVADAFVSAARESDAAGAQKSSVQETRWSWDERPVITATDGAFSVGKLSPGVYTVRAYRKGGGEAVAEHVALGGTARLQIKSTGSLDGTARRAGGMPDELSITVRDPISGFWRREQFFKTAGHFTIKDVPKGHFRLNVEAEGGSKQLEVDLAEGEAKTGIDVELEPLITLTGRVVESGTTKPVPGLRIFAQLAMGGGGVFSFGDEDRENITDEGGHFTVKNVPRGKLAINAWPKDWNESDYLGLNVVRTVEGTGTVDIGDLTIFKKRVKQGDPVGELGVHFAQQPRDTPLDKREYKVSFIDPQGAAAKTDLQVGDVVTTVDGVSIAGEGAGQFWVLTRAPPGTKLALGLARGVTVTVTLAAP
jgi:protocatechuate 3,4-dioxygenase beta subunit